MISSIVEVKPLKSETIVSFILSVDEFKDEMRAYFNNNIYSDYQIIEIEEEQKEEYVNKIRDDAYFNEGSYIILTNTRAYLLEKNINEVKRFFFTSFHAECIEILSWRIVPLHDNHINNHLNIHNYINNNKLKSFSMNLIKSNSKISIVGARTTGKTTMINSILDHILATMNHENRQEFLQNTIIISSSDKEEKHYSAKYDGIKVLYRYDRKIIDSYIQKGDGAIIMDNCINGKKWINSGLFNCINSNKLFILASQYPYYNETFSNKFTHKFIIPKSYQNPKSNYNLKKLFSFDQAVFVDYDSFINNINKLNELDALVITGNTLFFYVPQNN